MNIQLKIFLKNFFKTEVFTTLRLFFVKNTELKFLVFKNGVVSVDRSAVIDIGESLYFNYKFNHKDPFSSFLTMRENSYLRVDGNFHFFSNSRISVAKNAKLIIGSGYINCGANIACFDNITIGSNVAIAENVTMRDSDNHKIMSPNHIETKPINIGNHVWIGMNSIILKGVTLGDGCIVAAGSVVNKSFPSNCLIGGVPAKIIKENLKWR